MMDALAAIRNRITGFAIDHRKVQEMQQRSHNR